MVSRVKDLFEAEAGSFGETMMAHNGVAGYKVPEYQRQYNWKKEHLRRLLADCLNGFYRLSASSEPEYTFLGSLILATDNRSEPSFDGASLIVVDGQQRLTSLILVTCALFQRIREHRANILKLSADAQHWLNAEIDTQLSQLHQCAVGQFVRLGSIYPYPRMIRSQDNRGDSAAQSEYRSPIGRFLRQFADHATNQNPTFQPGSVDDDAPGSHVAPSYQYICQELDRHLYDPNHQSDGDDPDGDISVVTKTAFVRAGFLRLFRRRDVHPDESTKNRCASELGKSSEAAGLVRLVLFSSYVTQRVVLTRVEAQSEGDAFDIFDALNTTGEPLTALETCKPLLIQFENERDGYLGSQSKEDWESVESTLAEVYSEPAKQQIETKQLLTSFALYFDGHPLPLDLTNQRRYLRDRFSKAVALNTDTARGFVRRLSEMAEFRLQYWDKTAIDGLGVSALGPEASDSLKLCLRFIADMNTSLAIPILARYWSEYGEYDEEQTFLSATKAVTAFLSLRRSVTGGTARIDSDFRRLMENPPSSGGHPLCIGSRLSNDIMSIEALRKELREFLREPRIGVEDKVSWMAKAKEVEFGLQSPRPLCRFLLLAAAHNARPDESRPGLLTDTDVVEGADLDSFNHRNWVGQKYATVEHIAPEAGLGRGWEPSIYARAATRQRIGNLLLLPEKENQSIGNSGWARKKIFYAALAARSKSERDALIKGAESQGYRFGKKTQTLLQSQERLNMLDHLANVERWTATLIEQRTENILGLAWDEISPWLFDD